MSISKKTRSSWIPLKTRIEVMKRCNFTCQECGEMGEYSPKYGRVFSQEKEAINWDCTQYRNVPMEIDHIIPMDKGGTNKPLNLQLLCRKCNRKKKNKIVN